MRSESRYTYLWVRRSKCSGPKARAVSGGDFRFTHRPIGPLIVEDCYVVLFGASAPHGPVVLACLDFPPTGEKARNEWKVGRERGGGRNSLFPIDGGNHYRSTKHEAGTSANGTTSKTGKRSRTILCVPVRFSKSTGATLTCSLGQRTKWGLSNDRPATVPPQFETSKCSDLWCSKAC